MPQTDQNPEVVAPATVTEEVTTPAPQAVNQGDLAMAVMAVAQLAVKREKHKSSDARPYGLFSLGAGAMFWYLGHTSYHGEIWVAAGGALVILGIACLIACLDWTKRHKAITEDLQAAMARAVGGADANAKAEQMVTLLDGTNFDFGD